MHKIKLIAYQWSLSHSENFKNFNLRIVNCNASKNSVSYPQIAYLEKKWKMRNKELEEATGKSNITCKVAIKIMCVRARACVRECVLGTRYQ